MFLKNRNISSKIKRSKVTDYAALIRHALDLVIYAGLLQIDIFVLLFFIRDRIDTGVFKS